MNKTAPIQSEGIWWRKDLGRFPNSKPPGVISWGEYLKAYEIYAERHGRGQSAERLAMRGGFGYWEITGLLGHEPKTWTLR